MMMILNLHFAIFLGSSWQIVGGLETPYITCCSLVVPATLKDHPVRWEKDEGQWRSYPLNDSIELDRYWQAFQAQAAGNEAKCSVLGSFFFFFLNHLDGVIQKRSKTHMLQICNQCPKISFSNRSKHHVTWDLTNKAAFTHSLGVPGCCDKSQVEAVEKRCRLGPQFLNNKTQFSGCVVDHIFGAHELFVCPFAKDKLDLNILRQSVCFWSDQIIMIRFIFVRQKQLQKYVYIHIYITTYTETLCVDLIALA